MKRLVPVEASIASGPEIPRSTPRAGHHWCWPKGWSLPSAFANALGDQSSTGSASRPTSAGTSRPLPVPLPSQSLVAELTRAGLSTVRRLSSDCVSGLGALFTVHSLLIDSPKALPLPTQNTTSRTRCRHSLTEGSAVPGGPKRATLVKQRVSKGASNNYFQGPPNRPRKCPNFSGGVRRRERK
jgi:hypothetical protein